MPIAPPMPRRKRGTPDPEPWTPDEEEPNWAPDDGEDGDDTDDDDDE